MKKIISLALVLTAVLALVSCGAKDTGKNGETKTSSQAVTETENALTEDVTQTEEETDEPETKEKKEDSPFLEMDFYEDGEMVTWKITDQVTNVFYHDGENITRYIMYTDYGTEEKAAEMADLLADTYPSAEDSPFTDIFVDGSYLATEYTEENFPYHTYEELEIQLDFYKSMMTAEY